ncbi:MAG: bifunctional diguanylate cyclase/phosphodiesterase [Lysobacter sp.]|nr:bifunctional diguanylate cyclase/phosphodiesterase [Lysobacter sp.]
MHSPPQPPDAATDPPSAGGRRRHADEVWRAGWDRLARDLQVPGALWRRWLVFTVVALAMGVLLSWLTFARSSAVLEVAAPLIERDLPAIWMISELQGAASESQQIAYELYGSSNLEKFRSRIEALGGLTAPRMRQLRDALPESEGQARLARLQGLQSEAERLLQALDRTFASPPVDRVGAHALLERISDNAGRRKQWLDTLAGSVHAQAEERGRFTRERIRSIIVLTVVFSALLLGATISISYFLAVFLRGASDRQRLALFPERNPSPVINLNRRGAVTYANPGSVAMAGALRMASPTLLLPGNLDEKLQELRESGSDRLHWEYALDTRIIDISVHRLEDFGTFHVYLSDVTERKHAEAQLEYQAFHDVLTRLPNRRAFENRIQHALADGRLGAVLLLGTDRFQSVVDTLGHAVADRIVCLIGDRLALLASGNDRTWHVHRFDGELFSVLLPRLESPDEALDCAARIAQEMSAPFNVDGQELFFSLAIGIASFPGDGTSVGELLRNADTALQTVKSGGGRAALRYTAQMSARVLERYEFEHELQRALDRGELELHYQPQLAILSGRITGVEALLRWRHPVKGMISPADFIPIAEETGAIVEIGKWVLATACEQNRRWQAAGLPPLVMAVNISPRQFFDTGLPQMVLRALEGSQLAPQWLELEVTEGTAMHDVDTAIATLHAFKSMGVSLSIDDFGTGHSSLAYLKRFPIDKLKIDRSFVHNMVEDRSDAAIARSVIELGHSLGLTIMAEGVETQAQLDLLLSYGCEGYQGYLCSRPKRAGDLSALLEEHHSTQVGYAH